MMKFLTVFFVLLYVWRVINQNKTYREIVRENLIGVKDQDIKDVLNKKLKDGDNDIIMFIIISIWLMVITIIEAFYMLFAFKYGSFNIVITYIVFWVVILLIRKIRSSIRTKKNNPITEEITKYSIKQMLVHIVDLIFFIYMFIKIFLN